MRIHFNICKKFSNGINNLIAICHYENTNQPNKVECNLVETRCRPLVHWKEEIQNEV